MSVDQYCLRWKNHQPNFISVFKDLLELEELVDVTLSVEGQHIKAHKVILSACSPYFKLLFTVTPCKQPIVILNDIKFVDLKTIVEFMYCGEINISDEQLADILEVAETLQVRGLFDPNKQTETLPSEKRGKILKKKRKLSSGFEGPINHSPNGICQQLCDELNPVETNFDGAFVLNQGLDVNDQTFNSENGDEVYPNLSFDGFVGSLSNSQENRSGMHLPDHSVTISVPHRTRTVTGKIRAKRRNSKIQESEKFLQALEAVRSGRLGFCKAAKIYGLNNRTLWLEYKKRGYPSNRPPVYLKPNKKHSFSS